MSTSQHGKEVLGKAIEQRWNNASSELLSILELLTVDDSRFASARRQILDVVNKAVRQTKAELGNYSIEHLKQESLV